MRTLYYVKHTSHKRTNTTEFQLYEVFRVVKSIETKNRKVTAGGWGRGEWEAVTGTGLWFCRMKRVLWTDGSNDSTTMRLYVRPLTAHLKWLRR